jgi:hypothetical protein
MTLPPWARVVQQSWYFHLAVAALIAGGGVAFVCFGQNSEVSWECLKAGLVAAGAYLAAAVQHSPGSASFVQAGPSAGEVNQKVVQVVTMQKEGLPVRVVAAR